MTPSDHRCVKKISTSPQPASVVERLSDWRRAGRKAAMGVVRGSHGLASRHEQHGLRRLTRQPFPHPHLGRGRFNDADQTWHTADGYPPAGPASEPRLKTRGWTGLGRTLPSSAPSMRSTGSRSPQARGLRLPLGQTPPGCHYAEDAQARMLDWLGCVSSVTQARGLSPLDPMSNPPLRCKAGLGCS